MCLIFRLGALVIVFLLVNQMLIQAEKERRIQRMVRGAQRFRREHFDRPRRPRRQQEDIGSGDTDTGWTNGQID